MVSLGSRQRCRLAPVLACALAVFLAAGLAPGLQGHARAANDASTALVGDVDGDCRVSVLDLSLIAADFGYSFGSLRYIPAYDINSDGTIDIFDIQRAVAHFGEHC
jgi:Dockerin type I domain